MNSRGANSGKVAAALFLVGAVVLLSTLALAWYSTQVIGTPTTNTETIYLEAVGLSGSHGMSNYAVTTSFASVWLAHTEALYLAVAGLILVGGCLGLWAGILLWRGFDRTTRRILPVLAILAVVLAASAPVLLVLVQPTAICTEPNLPFVESTPVGGNGFPSCDWVMPQVGGLGSTFPGTNYTFSYGPSPGPETSFAGSQSWNQYLDGGGIEYTHTWGPSVGWYVALAGTDVLLLGTLLSVRREKGSATTKSASSLDPISTEPRTPEG